MSDLRFLVDENYLGKPAVRSLHSLAQNHVPKASFIHFLDRFQAGTPDRDWLNVLASEAFVIITADRARRGGGDDANKLTQLCRELSITHVLVTHSIHRERLSDASRSGIVPLPHPVPMIDKFTALVEVWHDLMRVPAAPRGSRFLLRLNNHRRAMLRQSD